MNVRRFAFFAGKVTLAQLVTYVLVGSVAYPLFTREYYEGPNALFATFLRTQAEPDLWSHVMTWMVPVEILRGFLVALALYPVYDALRQKAWLPRFLTIAGLYLILGFWANASPMPGTLEGMLMLRPEFTPAVQLRVQPELIVQGLTMAAWVAWWMAYERRQAAAPVTRTAPGRP